MVAGSETQTHSGGQPAIEIVIVPAGRFETASELDEVKVETVQPAVVVGEDHVSEGGGWPSVCESARPANKKSASSSGNLAWPLENMSLAELSLGRFKRFYAGGEKSLIL